MRKSGARKWKLAEGDYLLKSHLLVGHLLIGHLLIGHCAAHGVSPPSQQFLSSIALLSLQLKAPGCTLISHKLIQGNREHRDKEEEEIVEEKTFAHLYTRLLRAVVLQDQQTGVHLADRQPFKAQLCTYKDIDYTTSEIDISQYAKV